MKSLTYDQLLLFLKNIVPKKNGGRLDLLENFLRGRDIPFKAGLWDWRNQGFKLKNPSYNHMQQSNGITDN